MSTTTTSTTAMPSRPQEEEEEEEEAEEEKEAERLEGRQEEEIDKEGSDQGLGDSERVKQCVEPPSTGDEGLSPPTLQPPAPPLALAHPPPPTIIYGRVILGEITPLLAAMRKGGSQRWSTHTLGDSDPLTLQLRDLQRKVSCLKPCDPPLPPLVYLDPFLSIIRSEDTTGPVTRDALAAINRMVGYGLLDPPEPHTAGVESLTATAAAAESIAAAVTRARFVGTEAAADEAVLFGILWVLRALVLCKAGPLLTNDSVCEILNSAFRICFETRLSDLLRTCTEEALRQMVTLIFSRLPLYSDDPGPQRKVKMRAGKGRNKAAPPVTPAESSGHDDGITKDVTDRSVSQDDDVKKCSSSDGLDGLDSTKPPQDSSAGSLDSQPTPEDSQKVHTAGTMTITDSVASDTAVNDAVTTGADSKIMEDSQGVDSPGVSLSSVDSLGEVKISVESSLGCQERSQEGGRDETEEKKDQERLENESLQKMEEDNVRKNKKEEEEEEEEAGRVGIKGGDISSAHLARSTEELNDDEDESEEKRKSKQARSTANFVNSQGVKFTAGRPVNPSISPSINPFGLPCVRELLRFLISLTSADSGQNTQAMIITGLKLITVALEVSADHISQSPTLVALLRDQLCKNLLQLLSVAESHVKLPVYMCALRLCALLCESLRVHMKFQVERIINRLLEIAASESGLVTYQHRELALETLVGLWRIDGLTTELFINFDCDLYSSNLLEESIKTLSKQVFPLQGLFPTNLLCLDGLIGLLAEIDDRGRMAEEENKDLDDTATKQTAPDDGKPGVCRCNLPPKLIIRACLSDGSKVRTDELIRRKKRKGIIANGTELFNTKPDKGIAYLVENGALGGTDADIATFLRENPQLCKKAIGNYVSAKKNVGVLSAFVHSFNFSGLRIDEAVRTFLESFRLPGEAPLISLIMEHFASHWFEANDRPFGSPDSAFTLSYAVIILNVDQHNRNARKQSPPMTLDQFRCNLRGVDDGKDFDQAMLEEIYNAIRQEEFVLPSEQKGSIRDDYLWRMTINRGKTDEAAFQLANRTTELDRDIFQLAWGPSVAALSYVYDKTNDEAIARKVLSAYDLIASISARFCMADVFDNLIVTLCKFTGLNNLSGEQVDSAASVFGGNTKGQLAAKEVFSLVASHGDSVRDGWRNVVEVLVRLFRSRLLPVTLTEGVDFLAASGKVSLQPAASLPPPLKAENSLLSSLYSYITLVDPPTTRTHTHTDPETVTCARACVRECHPERIISESVYLRTHTLMEFMRAILDHAHMDGDVYTDAHVDAHTQAFLLELCVRILTANKDRAHRLFPCVRSPMYAILTHAAAHERVYVLERTCVCVLKVTQVLLRRPRGDWSLLIGLRWLLALRPKMMRKIATQTLSGLKEVVTANTEHLQSSEDWEVIFHLVEYAAAGVRPPHSLLAQATAAAASDEAAAAAAAGAVSPASDSDGTIDSGLGSDDQPQLPQLLPQSDDGGSGGSSAGSPLQTSPGGQLGRTESPDGTGGWILVSPGGEVEPPPTQPPPPPPTQPPPLPPSPWGLLPPEVSITRHRARALMAGTILLSALAKDLRPPHALASAAHAARMLVEAALHGGLINQQLSERRTRASHHNHHHHHSGRRDRNNKKKKNKKKNVNNDNNNDNNNSNNDNNNSTTTDDDDDSDDDDGGGVVGDDDDGGSGGSDGGSSGGGGGGGGSRRQHQLLYQQVSEKLLDLMGALHTSAGQLATANHHSSTTTTTIPTTTTIDMWNQVLCPLLQGIARLCCDARPSVRSQALTTLQRALLTHDLVTLSAGQWEALFHRVLFPLLAGLIHPPQLPQLPPSAPQPTFAPGPLEEARLRAATLVMKVYLRHLSPLLSLPTFTALWLTILEFLDKYLSLSSDHLREAVPEMLKNMLLVMETTKVFHTADGFTKLWTITWDRIDAFLPSLRHNLFRSHPPSEIHAWDTTTATTTTTTTTTTTAAAATGTTTTATTASKMEEKEEESEEVFVPPTLREQQAARLSLSQENLPDIIENSGVILQPPLPAPQASSSNSQPAASILEGVAGLGQSQATVPPMGQSSLPIILQSLPVFTDKPTHP